MVQSEDELPVIQIGVVDTEIELSYAQECAYERDLHVIDPQ